VSSAEAAPIGRIQVLRGATYFLALLIVSLAALLALVDRYHPAPARIAFGAFGLVIAATLVLWVHQPIGTMTVSSAILLGLAFIVPATLVHETFSSAHCVRGVPCDPVPNGHLGLRVGLAAVLLFMSLVTAAAGAFRSRLSRAPLPGRRSLA
jgi:hypothetical protein